MCEIWDPVFPKTAWSIPITFEVWVMVKVNVILLVTSMLSDSPDGNIVV